MRVLDCRRVLEAEPNRTVNAYVVIQISAILNEKIGLGDEAERAEQHRIHIGMCGVVHHSGNA